HLPLGSNVLIARKICLDLSREFGVLRAPTFSFGVNVMTARAYAGTASLGRKTLHRGLNELLDAWEAHGVQEFVIVTAHRHDPHLEALATLVTAEARVRVIDVWDVPIHDLLEGQEQAEHAGEAETSVMLHLYPEIVRMERARDFQLDPDEFRRYIRGGMPKPPPGGTGSVGRPSLASAEKGRRLYDRILDAIRRVVFVHGDQETDTL
ncbi:MAG: creatininase family protein, partial [Longimicrobiales bacterium]|nr:creatininase family protein [Longimicrobiales bacterium]